MHKSVHNILNIYFSPSLSLVLPIFYLLIVPVLMSCVYDFLMYQELIKKHNKFIACLHTLSDNSDSDLLK